MATSGKSINFPPNPYSSTLAPNKTTMTKLKRKQMDTPRNEDHNKPIRNESIGLVRVVKTSPRFGRGFLAALYT